MTAGGLALRLRPLLSSVCAGTALGASLHDCDSVRAEKINRFFVMAITPQQ
jgi:hypothetical protein